MSHAIKPIYLALGEVAAAVTLGEATIQRLVRENQSSKPGMFSGRRVA